MKCITGDVHGHIDIGKLSSNNFPEGKDLTKKDYLIVCGDFGLVWDWDVQSKQEKYWIDWLTDKPWTTLFVDGNHENFDRLNNLPTCEKFNNTVGVVSDSIFHLKRGNIYNIDGETFFALGGGYSIDQIYREEGKSWWPQELPKEKEMEAFFQLAEEIKKVDYVISHVPPINACPISYCLSKYPKYYEYKLCDIYHALEFKHWYCGHLHEDKQLLSKVRCLYNDIIFLENA